MEEGLFLVPSVKVDKKDYRGVNQWGRKCTRRMWRMEEGLFRVPSVIVDRKDVGC